jgi:uncharacterized protein (UPF0264 family)
VAKLLVSVRSAVEAREALAGGAAIIDVKEPARGPLGCAGSSIWREVRRAVPARVPVSVALGELTEWLGPDRAALPPGCWTGLAYRKLGLAEAGWSWRDRWRELREELDQEAEAGPVGASGSPAWVAVAYLDWEAARAPDPGSIIRAAAEIEGCRGVLFDTWDKARRAPVAADWGRWIARVQGSGRFVALAGSLDVEAIRRLRPLEPEVFAVRGAACAGGDRRAAIDRERVARLVEAAGPATPAPRLTAPAPLRAARRRASRD